MKKELLILASLLLLAPTAFAKQSVTVSVTNNISSDVDMKQISGTGFKSNDFFDLGSVNNQALGTISHTYKHGPKNITYNILLTPDAKSQADFSNCPELQAYCNAAGCYSETYNTGDYSKVNLNIGVKKVDGKYVIACKRSVE